MKITITASIALLTALALPVAASPRDSMTKFCTAVRQLNAGGIPVSPGTIGGYRIASEAQVDQATYRRFWDHASVSNVPACRGIF